MLTRYTGSVAAAGSSFLAAAAEATQGAQASVSSQQAAAASQVAQAGQRVQASQTAAITATQAAIAIVGSIIASALITILIYFLIVRHRRKTKERSRGQDSPGAGHGSDPKFPVSDQTATTIAPSTARDVTTASQMGSPAFSLFPNTSPNNKPAGLRGSIIKTTTVPWNPSKPPNPPSLGSWLQIQDISPFGSIKLPADNQTKSPLDGQLKSPLRDVSNFGLKWPNQEVFANPSKSPKGPLLDAGVAKSKTIKSVTRSPPPQKSFTPEEKTKAVTSSQEPTKPTAAQPVPLNYRESKESVWTDADVPEASPSPSFPPSLAPAEGSVAQNMAFPPPKGPVRNTAEWLAERRRDRRSRSSGPFEDARKDWAPNASVRAQRPGIGPPSGPRTGSGVQMGPWRPPSAGAGAGPSTGRVAGGGGIAGIVGGGFRGETRADGREVREVRPGGGGLSVSVAGVGMAVEGASTAGLNKFLAPNRRGSTISVSRSGSDRSAETPGIGKAK